MGNIITKENFKDVDRMLKFVRVRANNNNGKYSYEQFYIVREELFNKFCEKYGIDSKTIWWWGQEHELKNKSTIAEVVKIFYIEYHYDARCERESWDKTSKFLGVVVDGEILRATFYKSPAATFTFLNDTRRYSDILPYNWDDEHPEPNRRSELTDKKIQAWLDWLRMRRDTYIETTNANEEKRKQFLARVIKASKNCKEKRIDSDNGYLVANNIRYSYKIHSDGGITQDIKLDRIYLDEPLDAFLKMATGKYDK